MKNQIIGVDSLNHAQSVIKSLRSRSLSQKRYQRSAVDDEHIFQNITSFDAVVQQQASEESLRTEMEEKIAKPIQNVVRISCLNFFCFTSIFCRSRCLR